MKLFVMEGFTVVVDPELRKIGAFRDLIAEDKNRDKKNATDWFAYIYHYCDYKSPYQMYHEEERHIRILKDLKLPPDFKLSKRMQAVGVYVKPAKERNAHRVKRSVFNRFTQEFKLRIHDRAYFLYRGTVFLS